MSTSQGILFLNREGDRILFDGWTVRKISGARNNELEIYDVDKVRYFKRNYRVLSKHHCGQWATQKNLGFIRYSQSCKGLQDYVNTILVREDGNVSTIRQIVDERYTVLTLTKLE